MRESTKGPVREPKVQAYGFPTELGDYEVFPVFGKWSFCPTISNGGADWSVIETGLFPTAREAVGAAVRWAQENYDGPVIPGEIDRVVPHWDRPGTTFNPGGWAYDGFLFHDLQEVIDYVAKPPEGGG